MKNESPLFSIVIPVFNKWELTQQCLKKLSETTQGLALEVLVVDNNSSDATKTELNPLCAALFSSFRTFHLSSNINFGPACNLGAREARGDLLFFLNNDTEPTENFLPPLLNALNSHNDLACVGPLLLYPDQRVQHLGVAFNLTTLTHLYRSFPSSHPVVRKARRVQTLTAAALLMPRRLFLDLEGFFPGYRNGFEDVDLCLRLNASGKKLLCEPSSVIIHLESQSSGRGAHDAENARLLHERVGHLVRPDLHLYGLRDGFKPELSDTFAITLSLTDEQEQELMRSYKDFADLEKLCRENPFFRSGREVLAAHLEKQGLFEQALFFRSELAFYHKRQEYYLQLLKLKNKVAQNNTALFRDAQKAVEDIAAKREKSFLHATWKLLSRLRDPILNRLYEEKRLHLMPKS